MTVSIGDLIEDEARVVAQTKRYDVALEDSDEYAKRVGIIISLFAMVETSLPWLLAKATGFSVEDTRAILGVFRAFSNKLELVHELAARRPEGSPAKICLQYFGGLGKEANKIRNKYAHATYSNARTHFMIQTYSGDFNRNEEHIKVTLESLDADTQRLKRIICEYELFWHQGLISSGLHKVLARPTAG